MCFRKNMVLATMAYYRRRIFTSFTDALTLGLLPFGAAVWAGGYVILPAAGLYQPIWKYDAQTLAWDLAGHLAYGAGTGITFLLLDKAWQ